SAAALAAPPERAPPRARPERAAGPVRRGAQNRARHGGVVDAAPARPRPGPARAHAGKGGRAATAARPDRGARRRRGGRRGVPRPGARAPGQRQVGVQFGHGRARRGGDRARAARWRRPGGRAAARRPGAAGCRSARRRGHGRSPADHARRARAHLRAQLRALGEQPRLGALCALAPFVDEPGGRMLYSTGSYHLLSAVLTRVAGRSTLELARAWLGEPLGIAIPPWTRDPQGFYLGGNNMLLSPRALLRFAEMYRRGGTYDGRRVLPASWIAASWTPRVRSRFTGHAYGYGWFIARAGEHPVFYGWGYGGQMVYVVPDLGLSVVMTSDHTGPSGRNGYVRALHDLLARGIVVAAERGNDA